jgi:hypothetical protein
LEEILSEKGYSSVRDCIGKLKPWSKEGAALTRAAANKKHSATSSASGSGTKTTDSSAGGGINWIVDLVLVVVVAVLLAERFGLLSIPE